jgi:hypothetical protein
MSTYHKTIHELKTQPPYFTQIEAGLKLFELRKDDRGYAVEDLLILREWLPEEETYTGYVLCVVVTSIVRDGAWLTPGYVALGIRVLE